MEQMITDLFLKLLNLSISAGWLIMAVVLLRFIFKKAPKWVNCLLWGIAGLRLLLPFSVESMLSLVPSAETVPPEILYEETPHITSGISSFNSMVNPIIGGTFATVPGASVNPIQVLTIVFSYLWIIGLFVLIAYAFVSYIRLKGRMKTATLLKGNIFESENVGSPFVLGIIKPKIYLPYNIGDDDRKHVIAHEKAHIRRKDHFIKPLAYLILCVYWFNPLVWVAYIFLCRDIEMACDEKVIREMDGESRKDYSEALLNCSVNRRKIAACPLAFGEVGVKDRIKKIMNYKKPAFWVIVIAVISCVITAVCFLTNPVTEDPIEESNYYPIIDEITADIDGDGKKENCVLTYGPTSGLYTVVFTATEVGSDEPEYINTFNMTHTGGTHFYKTADGKTQIRCENSEYLNGEVVETDDIFLDIEVKNGNIVLKNGDKKVGYWGAQGINPYGAMNKINKLEKAIGEAVIKNNKNAFLIAAQNPENAEAFEALRILHIIKDEEKDVITVYAQTLYEEFNLENAEVVSIASVAEPVEVVFDIVEDGVYELKKYRPLDKDEDIKDILPDDYKYDDAEMMEALRFETMRQAKVHYGYVEGDIHEDTSTPITFLEEKHEDLELLISNFVASYNEPENYEFEHYTGFKRRVFHNNTFYYYCGYKNDKDMVFVFFEGFGLEPVYILDYKNTFSDITDSASIDSFEKGSSEYKKFESMILEIDKNT